MAETYQGKYAKNSMCTVNGAKLSVR